MQELRRTKRLPVDIKLTIENLYKQDNVVLTSIYDDIEILNISKTGIGFVSHNDMPLGFYFNARIVLEEDKKFYGVLKIIRKHPEPVSGYSYGCEFVGLADVLSLSIDEYEKEHDL